MPGIVFAPLTSSPETVGDGILSLPPLGMFALEPAGGYGIFDLPPLEHVAAGTYTRTYTGTGVLSLPPITLFGTSATLVLANATAIGNGVLSMPALTTFGMPTGGLAPQSGDLDLALPGLQVVGTGYRSLFAGLTIDLQPLYFYAQEASGGYGVLTLPLLAATAAQALPSTANSFWMYQSQGYLQAFASETTYMSLDANAMASGTVDVFEVMFTMIANAAASGTYATTMKLRPSYAASAVARDALAFAWNFVAEATADASGVSELTVRKYLDLVDGALAAGTFESKNIALMVFAAAAAARDAVTLGWTFDITDSALAQAAFEDKLRVVIAVAAQAEAAASFEPFLKVSLVYTDSALASGAFENTAKAMFDADSTAMAYVTMRLGAGTYSGWVLNAETLAPSEYQGLAIDSFVEFNGKQYAAGPGGLVRFEGATDQGAPIPAWLRTFLTDFKTTSLKRGADVYVGATTAGTLIVKVRTADPRTGTAYEDWYRVENLAPGTPGQGRGKVGEGLTSTWWQYEIHNVSGADFELDEIDFRPVLLDRRL